MEIKETFIEICHHYSFDRFCLANFYYSKDLLNFALVSDNYLTEWLTHYNQNQYYLNDPRLENFGKIHSPIIWDLEKELNSVLPAQQKIFKESCDFNIRKGITIPFSIQNESQSFLAVHNKKKIHPEALHIVTLAADVYFKYKKNFEFKRLITSLTSREHEILNLKSEGLSAKKIAVFLQVSESTVTFHLINIKNKLNATSIDHALFKFGAAIQ